MRELSFVFSCFLVHFDLNSGMNFFRNFSKFILSKEIFAMLLLNSTKTKTNDASREL